MLDNGVYGILFCFLFVLLGFFLVLFLFFLFKIERSKR